MGTMDSFMDGFMDRAKAKAKEWDLGGKAEKVAAEVGKAAGEAKDKAAVYADENRDKVSGMLDKAGATIDERTEGKYSDRIAKAKDQVSKGVGKLADQRPDGSAAAGAGAGAGQGAGTPQDAPFPADPAAPAAGSPTTATPTADTPTTTPHADEAAEKAAEKAADAWSPKESWTPDDQPWSPDTTPSR